MKVRATCTALVRASRDRLQRPLALQALRTVTLAASLFVASRGLAQSEVEREPPTVDASATRSPLADSTPVSFREIVQRAQRDPPAVLSALASLSLVGAQEQAARGALLPRLTLEALSGVSYDDRPVLPTRAVPLTLTDGTIIGRLGGGEAGRIDATSLQVQGAAQLSWTALDLARGEDVQAANAATRAEQHAVHVSQRAAILAACELYIRAGAAETLFDDAVVTLTRRSAQQRALHHLAAQGLRPAVDAQRASIELVRSRHMLTARRIDLLATGAALAVAVGADPRRPLRPVLLERDALAHEIDVDEAASRALASRPEVKQGRQVLRAREHELRASLAARVPTVGASARTSVTYQEVLHGQGLAGMFTDARAVFDLRWSGLDANTWRRATVARAAKLRAARELEATQARVRAEAVDAAYAVQRAWALLEQAIQVLEAATVTRTAQSERYREGVASILELLDAEGTEQLARSARIEAERDLQLAQARLLVASGIIEQLAP